MGATLAHHAPPPIQAAISTLMRARLELVVAGLDGSGKTTLVELLRNGRPAAAAMAPTTGLVFHRTRRSGISLQIWDLGGGRRFRRGWTRQAQTCDALLFVVDCADAARLHEARQALHDLLAETGRRGLPMLVLVNKLDLIPLESRGRDEAAVCAPVIRELGLDARTPCEWCVLGVSGKAGHNMDKALRWLVLQAHTKRAAGGSAGTGAGGGGGGGDAVGSGGGDGAAGLWEALRHRGRALERRLGRLRAGRRYVSVATLRGALLDDADEGIEL